VWDEENQADGSFTLLAYLYYNAISLFLKIKPLYTGFVSGISSSRRVHYK
jgi:hypothetical protein